MRAFLLWLSILFTTASISSVYASSATDTIAARPCKLMTYNELSQDIVPRSRPPRYLNIPLAEWDKTLVEAVFARIKECQGRVDEIQTRSALQYLPEQFNSIMREAENAAEMEQQKLRRAEREAAVQESRRQQLEDNIAAARERVAKQQTNLEQRLKEEAAQREIRAIEQAANEKTKETEEQFKREGAEAANRRNELAAKQQVALESEKATIIAQRIAALDPVSKGYAEQNPGTKLPSCATDCVQGLSISYAAEIVLRVCREKYGTYETEIIELKKQTRAMEEILVKVHDYPFSKISEMRRRTGVDGGTSEIVDSARLDRNLSASCAQFASIFGLAPKLR